MPATLSQQPTATFPLGLQPKPHTRPASIACQVWASDVKAWIETTLSECGAILVRGLPIVTADDFAHFTACLGYATMSYAGGTAIRHVVAPQVMTASNEPPAVSMEPHNEMAYARLSPSKIIFFCETPPTQGGETPIVDVRQYEERIDSSVREKIKQTGIKYIRYLPHRSATTYTSWQEAFFTDDPQAVEHFCLAHHYDFSWDPDNNFTYSYVLPATVTHPKTDDELWFNQISPHHVSYFHGHPEFVNAALDAQHSPFHCQYGDGTEFPLDVLAHLRHATWTSAVAVSWRQGDLLILDNLLTQHGRMSFEGARKILVALLQ